MVIVEPSTLTAAVLRPDAVAESPFRAMAVAPDSSQPPEASVWLAAPVAPEVSALTARIWAAVAPVEACRTEAEMVVHVVAEEACELEAAEAEVAPVVEQAATRAPAARAARAPAVRERNRRRAPEGPVGCAGGVGLWRSFRPEARWSVGCAGGVVMRSPWLSVRGRGWARCLAFCGGGAAVRRRRRGARAARRRARRPAQTAASSRVRTRCHLLAGSSGWSSAIPVAYFEMAAGRCPAAHSHRSADEGAPGVFVSTMASAPAVRTGT